MTKLDETMFEKCKWCNGSGNDGSGVCPDCECTGLKGGQYAAERFDDFIEHKRKMNVRERLEEIKQTINHPNYTEHNGQEEIYFMVSDNDFNWLIQQAERVEDLEKKLSINTSNMKQLQKRNERYKQALEFYADENNYREQELKGIVPPRPITFKPILHDYGSIARQALEESECGKKI